MVWARCRTAQGDTEPQTAIAADSWSSHWDTGTALGLVLGVQLAASTPPPPACRAAAMAGQQLSQAPTPHRQAWSHPAHAAQNEACTSCSSPIPPGCRISPGTHPNHSSQGSLDQARRGQARGGHISCGWFFLNVVWLPHVHATPGCSHWPCHASSHQEYQ